MKNLYKYVFALALLVVLSACSSKEEEKKNVEPTPAPTKAVEEVLDENEEIKIFAELISVSEMNDFLDSPGSDFLIFAPTDEAIKQSGVDIEELKRDGNELKLRRFVNTHIVEGQRSDTLKDGQSLKALSGETLVVSINDGKTKVGDANVISGNEDLQIIDKVLSTI